MSREYQGPGRRFGRPRTEQASPRKIVVNPKKPAPAPPGAREPHHHERLPDGSTVSMSWTGGLWHCVLTVAGIDQRFEGKGRNQFTVLSAVDKKLRKWIKQQKK